MTLQQLCFANQEPKQEPPTQPNLLGRLLSPGAQAKRRSLLTAAVTDESTKNAATRTCWLHDHHILGLLDFEVHVASNKARSCKWSTPSYSSIAFCCQMLVLLFSSSLLGKLAGWQVLVHTWVLHLLWPNKACHSQGPQLQKPSSVWKLLDNFLTEVLVISKPSQLQSCQVPLKTLELGWCYSYVVFCTSNSVLKLACFCAAKSPTHGTP